jgi:hypothetical protein
MLDQSYQDLLVALKAAFPGMPWSERPPGIAVQNVYPAGFLHADQGTFTNDDGMPAAGTVGAQVFFITTAKPTQRTELLGYLDQLLDVLFELRGRVDRWEVASDNELVGLIAYVDLPIN